MLTYKCLNPSARPSGDPTITCGEDGSWSDISFTCDSVCKSPMTISNSVQLVESDEGELVPIEGEVFGVGVVVTYKCKSGHYQRRRRKGKVTRATCTQSGKWEFVNPAKCRPGCILSESPAVPNAKLIGSGNRYREKFFNVDG